MVETISNQRRHKIFDNHKIIRRFKYADHIVRGYHESRFQKIKNTLPDIFKLAAMYLICWMFTTYAKVFTADLENSYLNDLANLTLNGNTNTSDVIIKEKLDQLGYANFASEKELEKSIEKWRQPEDKLMYGEFLKVIKNNLTNYDDDTDLLTALVEVSQETQTWQNNIAALFVAFKEIRKLIFGIKRECKAKRDRKTADICEIPSKQNKILKNQDLKDNKNTTRLKSKAVAIFSGSNDRSALFNQEKCFCRHGKALEPENTFIQHFIKTCSKNVELCQACHKGFKHIKNLCLKNECLCDHGIADSHGCPSDEMQRCVECHDNYHLSKHKSYYPGSDYAFDSFNRCEQNICTCQNGQPKSGIECVTHKEENCTPTGCNPGFHFDSNSNLCKQNECTCRNGETKTGIYCIVHGKEDCVAFDSSHMTVKKVRDGFLVEKVGSEKDGNSHSNLVIANYNSVTDYSVEFLYADESEYYSYFCIAGWTTSTMNFKSGIDPLDDNLYPTIGHGSMVKNFLYAGHNQGPLDTNLGQPWHKFRGKVSMKRENGLLKWYFGTERDNSTIVVRAEDYGLDETMLNPLIHMYWKGTKILIRNLS